MSTPSDLTSTCLVQPGIFKLPFELRFSIYKFLLFELRFQDPKAFYIASRSQTPSNEDRQCRINTLTHIFQVNSQIRAETRPYRNVIFNYTFVVDQLYVIQQLLLNTRIQVRLRKLSLQLGRDLVNIGPIMQQLRQCSALETLLIGYDSLALGSLAVGSFKVPLRAANGLYHHTDPDLSARGEFIDSFSRNLHLPHTFDIHVTVLEYWQLHAEESCMLYHFFIGKGVADPVGISFDRDRWVGPEGDSGWEMWSDWLREDGQTDDDYGGWTECETCMWPSTFCSQYGAV